MRAENVFILLIFCFLFYPRNSLFQFHCLLHGFHEQIKKKSMCVCVGSDASSSFAVRI